MPLKSNVAELALPIPVGVPVPIGDVSEQGLAPSDSVERVVFEDADCEEPRPVVPSPVVPRPLVPRAVTPRPVGFGEMVAVAGVELPRPNDTGEGGEDVLVLVAVVPAELRVPVTPELRLTELHGADVVLFEPMPEVVKAVVGLSPPLVGLIPPPLKGDRAAAPGPPLVQGSGLAASVNGTGVFWELFPRDCPKSAPSGDVASMPPPVGIPVGELAEVWPKSAPSGDVDPMMPGKGALVCAAIWSIPGEATASTMTAERIDFI
jgi:hypothetical protein